MWKVEQFVIDACDLSILGPSAASSRYGNTLEPRPLLDSLENKAFP